MEYQQEDQTAQYSQPATSITNRPPRSFWSVVSKPQYMIPAGLIVLIGLLIVGSIVWQSLRTPHTANGQRLVNVRIDNNHLTPSEIDATYNERLSVVITATHQTTPEELTIPAYSAQTTAAQYSTTNVEFTTTARGSFPIFRVSNGIQYEIGKVVVR